MKNNIHETISATDLVRNFSASVDKVRITGRSLYITKGIQVIAALNPPPKSGLPIKDLANFLKNLPALGDDVPNMAKDIQSIKNSYNLPENPWG